MESFDRRFENLESKDSEQDKPPDRDLESFDRKIESFVSKDSDLDKPPDGDLESFDRKIQSFVSKDWELDKPANDLSGSFDRKIETFESKDSYNTRKDSRKDCKLDGRSGIRSVKQIEAYKRNFCKADSIELKVGELDVRMRHLQSLVLGVLRGRKN